LSPEDDKYYEAYFDIFVKPGWKQFITDVQEIFDSYRIEDIKDNDQLNMVKGERQILQRILNFENGIRIHYESIEELENDQAV